MRLHHLTVTAFGPFAGTVEVDFDELGSAGVFLLTGPTGAGKSSVLDAVCFALYGDVPGDRGGARQLRSDHAAPDDEPRVVLVLSVGDRVLRLSRSPAWDRPKRRGSGTRRIQASVVAEERRDGAWQAVSTRLDETGQLVGELLGMTSTQFTQVAMLPQGRFQTFLRASSAERHDVLKRLFRTRRYDDVERWLVEQRREAQRGAGEGLACCAALLDRLGEATGVELPTPSGDGPIGGRSTDVVQALSPEQLVAWAHDQEQAVSLEVTTAREEEVAEGARVSTLRSRLDEQQHLLRQRRRGLAARQRLDGLDATADVVALARQALGHDAAARPVLQHARRHQQTTARLDATTRALAQARAATPEAPLDSASLEADLAALARRQGEAEGWLPREAELAGVCSRRAQLGRERDELHHTVETLAAAASHAEAELGRGEAERASLVEAVAALPGLLAEAARAAAGLAAAREAVAARDELRDVVTEQQALTATALRLRAAHLDAKQARIEGAAAELASGLAAGCSCPVCGSVEHPAPARGRVVAGQDTEDAALDAFESAETARMAADEGAAGVRARLASWEARSAGHDLVGWRTAREQADAAVDRARRDEAALAPLLSDLEQLRHAHARATTGLGKASAALQEREALLGHLDDREEHLVTSLAELLTGHEEGPHASVAALVDALVARRDRLESLLALGRAVDDATAAARQATEAVDDAVGEAGFPDVETCVAAVLPDAERDRLRADVAAWERGHAEATHVLADPEVADALEQREPDVTTTGAELDRHVAAHEEAGGSRRAAEHREQRVTVLAADLGAALEAWRPRRERHQALASLAALVEGTSPDNRLRMRLTGYVLAERLRQVVAAANDRLAAMTDQRFALEHAEEKGAGEQRGGLSLRVRDDWSGTRRDPATLSGGETFVVSLALALGLADTVAHEAGGAEVETLFVDEGFGALDSDTLDAVMDVLDGLRDGGRVVGLVSHVAELRERVPSQLEVRKDRRGSTLHTLVQPG